MKSYPSIAMVKIFIVSMLSGSWNTVERKLILVNFYIIFIDTLIVPTCPVTHSIMPNCFIYIFLSEQEIRWPLQLPSPLVPFTSMSSNPLTNVSSEIVRLFYLRMIDFDFWCNFKYIKCLKNIASPSRFLQPFYSVL